MGSARKKADSHFIDVTETTVDVSGSTIDCEAGTYFYKTISGPTTFAFTNSSSAGASSFTLELTNPGTNVTWPTSVVWPGGVEPTLTSTGTDILAFITRDNGTTWYGFTAGLDMQ